jgi:flagellar basal body-associated protein FliL
MAFSQGHEFKPLPPIFDPVEPKSNLVIIIIAVVVGVLVIAGLTAFIIKKRKLRSNLSNYETLNQHA